MESDEKTAVAIVALLLVEKKKKKIRVGKTLAGEENLSLHSMRR